MAKQLIYVRINGNSLHETFKAVSHEICGHPADTYHKFVLENGTTVYYNGFGIRTVVIADSLDKLN